MRNIKLLKMKAAKIFRRSAGYFTCPTEKLRKIGKPVVMRTTADQVNVAAIPMEYPLAVCTVHYLAGSRYESHDQLGATHFLRNCSGISGAITTGYMKTKHLQQLGAYMFCTSDRQGISYTMTCPGVLFDELKDYLLDAASRCCYNQWDLNDQKRQIKEDLRRMSHEHRLVDLLQKAAFKGALSNSVFGRNHKIDAMDSETLRSFVGSNFLSESCSVASSGITFTETIKFAESLDLSSVTEVGCNMSAYETEFKGGYEGYDLGPGTDTWLAIAVPGCGTKNLGMLLSHCVLAAACGTRNSAVGSNRYSHWEQAPLCKMGGDDSETEYRAFNISYIDMGLFGIAVRAPARAAWEAAFNAVAFLKNGLMCLTENQINVGKRRLIMDTLGQEESALAVTSGLVQQLVNDHHVQSQCELVSLISCLCISDVAQVANCIASRCGNLAVAVVGDVPLAPTDIDLRDCC